MGAVLVVEPQRPQGAGEQLLVRCARHAAAVLVGLDLDERRLGPAHGQAGQRERVRVGLLELVGAAVHGELAEVVEGALLVDPPRQRWPVTRGEGDQGVAHLDGGRHLDRADLVPHG